MINNDCFVILDNYKELLHCIGKVKDDDLCMSLLLGLIFLDYYVEIYVYSGVNTIDFSRKKKKIIMIGKT